MRNFAAAGGMANMDGVLQVEMRGQCCEVVGIVVHIMAIAGLARSAVAAAVMGYDAIAATEEEQHLIVPVVGRQRPTVTEHDGLTFAPVLVINLRAVFGCDHGHDCYPYVVIADPKWSCAKHRGGHEEGSTPRAPAIVSNYSLAACLPTAPEL